MKRADVFINCPFSDDYRDFFNAIVFTIVRSGFVPRCALELNDGAVNRFEKICKIIEDCSYAVHDISKTELDKKSGLPRFNMPLELGVFLGARRFGNKSHSKKRCIIFDRAQYRFQKFISDIAGQDISSHKKSRNRLIQELAAWLRNELKVRKIPGGVAIAREYSKFITELPEICAELEFEPKELTFKDYGLMISSWIVRAPRRVMKKQRSARSARM